MFTCVLSFIDLLVCYIFFFKKPELHLISGEKSEVEIEARGLCGLLEKMMIRDQPEASVDECMVGGVVGNSVTGSQLIQEFSLLFIMGGKKMRAGSQTMRVKLVNYDPRGMSERNGVMHNQHIDQRVRFCLSQYKYYIQGLVYQGVKC